MDVPKLGIIDSNELNAFATGLFKRDRLVAVTEGLAARLTDDEIEAVMAHELAHIKHRDILLSIIAATVAGGFALLAEMLFFVIVRTICFAFQSGDDDEEEGGISGWVAMLIGFVFVALGNSSKFSASVGRERQSPGWRLSTNPPIWRLAFPGWL